MKNQRVQRRFLVLSFLSLLMAVTRLCAQTGPGTALSFDGVSSYMQIGGAPLPPPWTAEFWVNRQDATTYSATLLGDASTALKLEQFNFTRRVGFTKFGVADYLFNYAAPTNTWVHLAFVCDTTTRLYVNGVLQDTNAATIPLPLGQLGNDSSGNNDHLRGTLDEVRVWNVARSQAQIQANMNRSLSLPQTNLVAYWRFDEGSGTNVFDASGSGHTAFLQNGVSWVASSVPFVPLVTTEQPSEVGTNSAILNGTVNPAGAAAFAWFQWGATTNYGTLTSVTNLGSGVSTLLVQAQLIGLSNGATYHFRTVASNSAGVVNGPDQTFLVQSQNTDVWVNPFSGKWEAAQNWSAGAPSITQQEVDITNAGSKTITVDAQTASNFPSTMSVSNLVVGVQNGSDIDKLALLGFLTNSPFFAQNLLLQNGAMLYVSNAAITVGKLTCTNSAASLFFSQGTMTLDNSYVSNGVPFVIGDSIHPATLALPSGIHTFANGLTVNSNALLTIGCASVNAQIVNNGTLVANCGGQITIAGIIDNNSTIIADGTTLILQGSIFNTGKIISTNGGDVRFYGYITNSGMLIGGQPPFVDWIDFADMALSATVSNALLKLTVHFDKPMASSSLANLTHYSFFPGSITIASPSTDGLSVDLTIKSPPPPGANYQFSLSNLVDVASNFLAPTQILGTMPFYVVDYALTGNASQSSIGSGAGPWLAIDGNTDGNFADGSVTLNAAPEDPAWWEVDLITNRIIGAVSIWFRTDCCNGITNIGGVPRDDNFTLKVLDSNNNLVWSNTYPNSPSTNVLYSFTPALQGRFVRVESQHPLTTSDGYFSLAEVEVLAPFTNYSIQVIQDLSATTYADSNGIVILGPFDVLAVNAPQGLLSYQWQSNMVNIPGATNFSYTTFVGKGDTAMYKCEVGLLGATASSRNTLAAIKPSPHVLQTTYSATQATNTSRLLLNFDTLLSSDTATNPASYLLDRGSVLGATFAGSFDSVLLTVSNLTGAGSHFAMVVSNVASSSGYGYGLVSAYTNVIPIQFHNDTNALHIVQQFTNIQLNWPGFGIVQSATNLNGPWTTVSNLPPMTFPTNAPVPYLASQKIYLPKSGSPRVDFFKWVHLVLGDVGIDGIFYTNHLHPGILVEGMPVTVTFTACNLGPNVPGYVVFRLIDPEGNEQVHLEKSLSELTAENNCYSSSFQFCSPSPNLYSMFLEYYELAGNTNAGVNVAYKLVDKTKQVLDVGIRFVVSLESIKAYQTLGSEGDTCFTVAAITNGIDGRYYSILDQVSPYNYTDFHGDQGEVESQGRMDLDLGPVDISYANLQAHQIPAVFYYEVDGQGHVDDTGAIMTEIADYISTIGAYVASIVWGSYDSDNSGTYSSLSSLVNEAHQYINKFFCQLFGGCQSACNGTVTENALTLQTTALLALSPTTYAETGQFQSLIGACNARYTVNYAIHRKAVVYLIDVETGEDSGAATSGQVSLEVSGTSVCGDSVFITVPLQNPIEPDVKIPQNRNNHPFEAGSTSTFMFVCDELQDIDQISLSRDNTGSRQGWELGSVVISEACNPSSYWTFSPPSGYQWVRDHQGERPFANLTPKTSAFGPSLNGHCFEQ